VDGYFVDAIKYNDLKSKSAFFGAREHVNIMRDLDALLNSLVNIDRDSLVAILTSEAEAAERLANSIRTRTSTQRLKRQQAVELATRINRILLFSGMTKPGRTCRTPILLFANLLSAS
jgi:hypothetical protein